MSSSSLGQTGRGELDSQHKAQALAQMPGAGGEEPVGVPRGGAGRGCQKPPRISRELATRGELALTKAEVFMPF